MRFADRRHAGELLAAAVEADPPVDPVIYGLPRGGVPVAYEVAAALNCDLDALIVAKVGLSYQPELALGAVAEDGTTVMNRDLLSHVDVSPEEFEEQADRVRAGLVDRWRGDIEAIAPEGKTAVIVDDGLATGATARAGISVLRKRGASSVWLAVPVAPRGVAVGADRFVVLHQPIRFVAVGAWYDDFSQTTDSEVRELLTRARLR